MSVSSLPLRFSSLVLFWLSFLFSSVLEPLFTTSGFHLFGIISPTVFFFRLDVCCNMHGGLIWHALSFVRTGKLIEKIFILIIHPQISLNKYVTAVAKVRPESRRSLLNVSRYTQSSAQRLASVRLE
jgi:hypothetical protein